MNKEKMLASLSVKEHEMIMVEIIKTNSWENVKRYIDEGYAVTPLLLQMMVEKGWKEQVENMVRHGCFYHEQDPQSLTKWFQGFFGEDEFLKLCLQKKWKHFLADQEVDPEILAKHGIWDLLVKRKEWQILIDHDQLSKLPSAARGEWIPLILKSGKGEFLIKDGWYMFARDFPQLKKETLAVFVNGQHWEELYQHRSFYGTDEVLNILFNNEQYELLIRREEYGILIQKGQAGLLVKNKCWSVLASYGYSSLIDWNDYYETSTDHWRKKVLEQAVEFGAADFLKSKGYRFLAFKARLHI